MNETFLIQMEWFQGEIQISESRKFDSNFILTTTKEICPGDYHRWLHARTPRGDQAKDS